MEKNLALFNEPMLILESKLVSLIESHRVLRWAPYLKYSHRVLRPNAVVKEPVFHVAVGDKTLALAMSAGYTVLQGGVAVVPVLGPIFKGLGCYGYADQTELRMHIRNAVNDPAVAAIMLYIDSPGGSVAGTQDLADEIRAAGKVKPTMAYAEDLCASAAMWIASACNSIYSNSSALLGSIGVITAVTDYSKMLENAGIKVTIIATGEFKSAGNPFKPTTDADVGYIRALIDSTMDAFVAEVSKGRGMRGETVRKMEARVFTAADAVENKLSDGVLTFDQAFMKLQKQTGKKSPATARALAEMALLEMEQA